jgi:chromosome segregation protein
MPVSLSRLRIAGFKSFAEPVTVEILPGLTGVIGPNGCGKSNVVEALRWAMGESNARTLRGGEMDDVIFAGTANRPSRNVAEVVVSLDDPSLTATDGETVVAFPPPFQDHKDLQISRRIERGVGSAYRVNGKEVRARDVQTLFADLASGARGSAMVSQGRVGALVSARPEERRTILEEAAGITGLHARRHEAELKLKAAEANLERAEDLRLQLDGQLQGLKRQARQAARYRTISASVRAAEAELLSVQRARVELARAAAAAALQGARDHVSGAGLAAAAAAAAAVHAQEALPDLRETEALARTALERHRLAQEQIAQEESRAQAAIDGAHVRLAQLERDLTHARQLERDASATAERLATEDASLAAAELVTPARTEALAAALAEASEAVREAEAAANRATEQAAELNARSQALTQALAQAEQRARRINEQLDRLRQDHQRAAAQLVAPARLAEVAALQDQAEQRLAAARADLDASDQRRLAAQAAAAVAREALTKADAERARLAAEQRALAEVLGVKDNERWPPMVDALNVPDGLEAALGAALGEALNAAADPTAARHWRELPPLPEADLPAGAVGFHTLVDGPPALARSLSRVGLVEDAAAAAAADLAPGQTLVSRDGAVWRWDGYAVRAGAPTAAAVRLQQRNRLAGVRSALREAEAATEAARATRADADAEERAAAGAEQQARQARREAEQTIERVRSAAATLRAQAATAETRLAGLDEQIARLQPERDAADGDLEAARAARETLPDLGLLRAAVERARAALSAARSAESVARGAAEALAREAAARQQRRVSIGREREDWAMRAQDAQGRVTDLAARAAAAEAERRQLAEAPGEIAARRRQAQEDLAEADAAWRRQAERLSFASDAATAADRAARVSEQALATARENVVRAESAAEQAEHAWGTVAERILERLGVDAVLPAPPAELGPEAEDKARRRFERLQKEREEMGPVNLRAEIEAEEIEGRLATLLTDREELSTAIAKLRGSIGHLNREGRERLSQIFADVDRHFQTLFSRMFGGGRAHLALVGSDDPLLAGLEIYAQPPGKKLSALSLLSGGEQALTALSLIFAVFRCNPAPICVLDEVDAPLDDANVERFCTLLGDMVHDTGTRFLVVTHHHLTMSRMDRLYGVTMQERGVSRVLSVDLQQATELVDEPRMAAE